MVRWIPGKKVGPIGLDIGTRSVKLVQMNADRTQIHEAARWDLPTEAQSDEERAAQLVEAINRARMGRQFRGRDVVLCLNDSHLFLQNIRIPKGEEADVGRLVQQEAAGRLPFPIVDSELRYIEAATVRQGDAVLREMILLACHRPVLDKLLGLAEAANLRPVAVDVEPLAMLRGHCRQFRRDNDATARVMFVHVGNSKTSVVFAQGDDALFVKYIDVAGRHMDEAVSLHLGMDLAEASALRRHNGDRRADLQDPEINRGMADALRPVLDRLCSELSMCARYHSVTFRGQPVSRMVLAGGEASAALQEAVAERLDMKCDLGDPFRIFGENVPAGRRSQWDVATGLALRDVN